MYRKIITTEFCLLWLLLIKGELFDFDDKTNDEFCSICYCSIYKTVVDCSHRGLIELPNGMSSTVKKLNISFNEISLFPKYLDKFYTLLSLDISSNNLSEIPEYALSNLTNLKVLDLSKNNFESWTKLHLNYILQRTTNLKILNLSHNKLKTISGDLEQVLSPSSLETLNLNNCEIESVNGESSLNGLNNLKVLNLNSNPLQKITNMNSKSLRALYVSNCLLTEIDDTEFSNLPSLVYLKMSYNYRLQLSTTTLISETVQYLDISQCNVLQPSLQGFPNIKKVVLSHNRIRYLRTNLFMNNTKLEYLDLSYNNIASIMADTFRGLTSLQYLDLSWNEIAIVPENSLMEMPSLTHLTLSKNYLTHVGYLKSHTMTLLDLSACRISTIEKDSLEGLPSLVNLNLSHNLITHIPDTISSNTLRHLILNVNRIRYVNNLTFSMLPQLTSLSVIGNRFTTIWKRSYFQSNIGLETLQLSDNMWRCDCENENMFDFYKFVTLEPCSKEDSSNLICNSTMNKVGQSWLEACYFTWYPGKDDKKSGSLFWLIIPLIIGICQCIMFVNCIRKLIKRCWLYSQEPREIQGEEGRDIRRHLTNRPDPNDVIPLPTYDVLAEQGASFNTVDLGDLPPTYDEALTMSKPPPYVHIHAHIDTRKSRRKRGHHKTESNVDLLDEMERNEDVPTADDSLEHTEISDDSHIVGQ